MQPVVLAAFPNCCYALPTRPIHFNSGEKSIVNNVSFPRNTLCSLTLPTTTNDYTKPQHENQNRTNSYTYPDHKSTFLEKFYTSFSQKNVNNQDLDPQNQEEEEEEGKRPEKTGFWGFLRVIFSKMWWTNLRAAVGQRINVDGIVFSVRVFIKDRHLALPHVAVRDIRCIDWSELYRRGFKGVVFDKDNTITVPYSLTIWRPLRPSIDKCKEFFGPDIAVFRNSAEVKKPAGTAEEIEKHFGYKSSQLIMVGDRPFTDVVYGNRNGFFTILIEPLSVVEEPFIVRQGNLGN
ncbi:taxadiene 5-alpha hydroxylase-like [Hibiscus syriacus]|uniref:Taxadiene 5-alpha hydroxylase-like n=1 Tax=Hibiscus syriacus TaxID=106335 RepID=A0A6A2WEL6_HIBSY|nr:taxadiene 5-alpha hydroxylase-like [Hibiscus syriacus]